MGSGFDGFVVGAPGGAARAYVYLPYPSFYYGYPVLELESNQGEEGFGSSVGVTFNLFGTSTWDILVGSTNYADQNGIHGGGVYAYKGPFFTGCDDCGTSPTTVFSIPSAQNQAGAAFGASIASFFGDTDYDGNFDEDDVGIVCVGAPYYTPTIGGQSLSHAGAAFIFAGPGSTPDTFYGQNAGAHFGSSMAAIGVLPTPEFGAASGFIVGAPDDNNGEATSTGSATVLRWRPVGLGGP